MKQFIQDGETNAENPFGPTIIETRRVPPMMQSFRCDRCGWTYTFNAPLSVMTWRAWWALCRADLHRWRHRVADHALGRL